MQRLTMSLFKSLHNSMCLTNLTRLTADSQ